MTAAAKAYNTNHGTISGSSIDINTAGEHPDTKQRLHWEKINKGGVDLMNNIKIKIKCSYCNKNITHYTEPSSESDTRLMSLLIKDNTTLCNKCANDTDARIWLSEYIMNSR